jgi:hypothetical protein
MESVMSARDKLRNHGYPRAYWRKSTVEKFNTLSEEECEKLLEKEEKSQAIAMGIGSAIVDSMGDCTSDYSINDAGNADDSYRSRRSSCGYGYRSY